MIWESFSVQRLPLTKLNVDALSHHILSFFFFFDLAAAAEFIFFSEIALHLLRRSAYDYPPTETSNWKTQIFVAFRFFRSLFPLVLRSLFCLSHLTAGHPAALFIHPPIKILAVQRNVCAYACVKGHTLLASSQHAVWGMCGTKGDAGPCLREFRHSYFTSNKYELTRASPNMVEDILFYL